jgi:hypothetical protein
MEDQKLETRATEIEAVEAQDVASYTILSYPASAIPDTYRALVFSKWLRSLRFGNKYYKMIDQEAYFALYHHYIEMLLQRPDAILRLSVLSDDHDVVLGFSVSRSNILDYVHVQKDMRKQGIGKSLVPQNINTITHITDMGLSFWNNVIPDAKFNPFI